MSGAVLNGSFYIVGGTFSATNDVQKLTCSPGTTPSPAAQAFNLSTRIAATLPPGAYTALLSGPTGSTGIGIGVVEIYDRGAP